MLSNEKIRPHRTTLVLATLGCFAFTTLGVFIAYISYTNGTDHSQGDRYFGIALGAFAAIVFCFFGILGIVRVVSSTPSLQILNAGLMPGWSGEGKDVVIPWEEISEIAIFRHLGQQMLGINLHEHKFYLSKLPSFKRAILLTNKQISGFLIGISAIACDQPINDILAELQARCEIQQ